MRRLLLARLPACRATPAWSVLGPQPNEAFGAAIASVGDVNGDAAAMSSSAPSTAATARSNEGRAFLYLGSAAGPLASPAWTGESNQTSALFGWSVAGRGDVDGDGYADVVVGAYLYDNGQADEGRAFSTGAPRLDLGASPAWTAEINVAGAFVGYAVAGAGDVNGDGFADVIVEERRAWPRSGLSGVSGGLSSTAVWTAERRVAGERRLLVAAAGDVDADGYADVLVGGRPATPTARPRDGRVVLHTRERKLSAVATGGACGPVSGACPPGRRSRATRPRRPRRLPSRGPGALALRARDRAAGMEVKPRGTPSRRNGDAVPWRGVGHEHPAGSSVEQPFSGLAAGTSYHWRVRLRHDPVTTPFLPADAWLTVPWGGWNEAMVRTKVAPLAAEVSGLRISKTAPAVLAASSCSGIFPVPRRGHGLRNLRGDPGKLHELRPSSCSTGGNSLVILASMPAGNRYSPDRAAGERQGRLLRKNGAGVERVRRRGLRRAAARSLPVESPQALTPLAGAEPHFISRRYTESPLVAAAEGLAEDGQPWMDGRGAFLRTESTRTWC